MARAHATHRFARAQQAADGIGGKHAVQTLGRQLVHPLGPVNHTGVVDQGVERPPSLVNRLEQVQHVRFLRNIAAQGEQQQPSL
jgi:hypothetical protein